MTVKVRHSVISDNGGCLRLVPSPNFPNMERPDISVPSSSQLYDIGTEWEYNGKAYFYAKASGTVAPDMPVKQKYIQDITQVVGGHAAAKYATSIHFHPNATDGPTSDSIFTKDYFKGGILKVFSVTATLEDFCVGIIGNPAYDHAAGSTSAMTFDLDSPIPEALDALDKIEAVASAYNNVVLGTTAGIDFTTVGVPCCMATTGQWLWVQTWGPTWLPTQSTVGTGGIIGAAFRHDGSLSPALTTVSGTVTSQYAGYTLAPATGSGQGAPFFYLMIAR